MTLKRHERNSHGVNAQPATCDECGKVFKHRDSLKTHLYVIHGHRKTSSKQIFHPYTCKYCSLTFRLQQELMNHVDNEHATTRFQYSF